MFEDILKTMFGDKDFNQRQISLSKTVFHSLLASLEEQSKKQNKSVFELLTEHLDEKVKILPINISDYVSMELNYTANDFKGFKLSTVKDYIKYSKLLLTRHAEYYINKYDKHMSNVINKLEPNKPYEDMTKEELIAELNKRK